MTLNETDYFIDLLSTILFFIHLVYLFIILFFYFGKRDQKLLIEIENNFH